ncbi:hypothetical protein TRVL_05764 [Trypanosoma vivax]|nr:hypothetical protein TRVL_05764 [Trypanosoma vivax]
MEQARQISQPTKEWTYALSTVVACESALRDRCLEDTSLLRARRGASERPCHCREGTLYVNLQKKQQQTNQISNSRKRGHYYFNESCAERKDACGEEGEKELNEKILLNDKNKNTGELHNTYTSATSAQ